MDKFKIGDVAVCTERHEYCYTTNKERYDGGRGRLIPGEEIVITSFSRDEKRAYYISAGGYQNEIPVSSIVLKTGSVVEEKDVTQPVDQPKVKELVGGTYRVITNNKCRRISYEVFLKPGDTFVAGDFVDWPPIGHGIQERSIYPMIDGKFQKLWYPFPLEEAELIGGTKVEKVIAFTPPTRQHSSRIVPFLPALTFLTLGGLHTMNTFVEVMNNNQAFRSAINLMVLGSAGLAITNGVLFTAKHAGNNVAAWSDRRRRIRQEADDREANRIKSLIETAKK